jgi:LPS sulfotransferase NodH
LSQIVRSAASRAFDGAEFDAPPDAVVAPSRAYVVCATPRSGSGLLCRSLAATGVAGTPLEYFDPGRRAMLSERWRCGSDLAAYVQALRRRRTDPSGVFGVKLHWHHVEALRAEMRGPEAGEAAFEQPAALIEDIVGMRPAYVRIMRGDVDRQAISLWTAQQTGVWSRGGVRDGSRDARVPYSFAGIQSCRRRIALGELHWDRFFRFNGITPTEVVYEELCSAHESVVAGVLERAVPGATAEIRPPATERLADARSEELLERFRRDLSRRHPLSLRERLTPRVRRLLRR